jgi:hypothetical protein
MYESERNVKNAQKNLLIAIWARFNTITNKVVEGGF